MQPSTISNYYRNIRAQIVTELVNQFDKLQQVSAGEVYHTASMVLSHYYARNSLKDFEIEVNLKNKMNRMDGYEVTINLIYNNGAIDDFVLFVEVDGSLRNVPLDPIEAYDRAMGIL